MVLLAPLALANPAAALPPPDGPTLYTAPAVPRRWWSAAILADIGTLEGHDQVRRRQGAELRVTGTTGALTGAVGIGLGDEQLELQKLVDPDDPGATRVSVLETRWSMGGGFTHGRRHTLQVLIGPELQTAAFGPRSADRVRGLGIFPQGTSLTLGGALATRGRLAFGRVAAVVGIHTALRHRTEVGGVHSWCGMDVYLDPHPPGTSGLELANRLTTELQLRLHGRLWATLGTRIDSTFAAQGNTFTPLEATGMQGGLQWR